MVKQSSKFGQTFVFWIVLQRLLDQPQKSFGRDPAVLLASSVRLWIYSKRIIHLALGRDSPKHLLNLLQTSYERWRIANPRCFLYSVEIHSKWGPTVFWIDCKSRLDMFEKPSGVIPGLLQARQRRFITTIHKSFFVLCRTHFTELYWPHPDKLRTCSTLAWKAYWRYRQFPEVLENLL